MELEILTYHDVRDLEKELQQRLKDEWTIINVYFNPMDNKHHAVVIK